MKSSLFHLYFNNFRGMINNLYQSQQIYNYVNFVVYVIEVFFSLLSHVQSLFSIHLATLNSTLPYVIFFK